MMKFDEGNGKISRLKNWFFKGRIKNSLEKEKLISILSKEYDEGKTIEIWQK